MSSIYDVGKMHRKFGFTTNDRPTFLNTKLMQMRLNFIFEELNELAEATGFILGAEDGKILFIPHADSKPDIEESLDALLDIVYVTLGTADMMGFGGPVPIENMSKWATIWWEAWSRVHEANMAKEKGQTSRGHEMDLIKPEGWKKPEYGDLLV